MRIYSITSDMKSLVDMHFYSRDRAGFTYSEMLLTLGLPFSFQFATVSFSNPLTPRS